MADEPEWLDRYTAERLREHDERARQRELEKDTRVTRWARIKQERQRRDEDRARLHQSRDQPCGATTRAGYPCRRKGLGRGGRCPNHGGLSTGPRTEAGRRACHASPIASGRCRPLCRPPAKRAPVLCPNPCAAGGSPATWRGTNARLPAAARRRPLRHSLGFKCPSKWGCANNRAAPARACGRTSRSPGHDRTTALRATAPR
jgi:hypothetical protein